MEGKQWNRTNIFNCLQFCDLEKLCRIKENKGLKISLVLPTYNERKTVVPTLKQIISKLVRENYLLDEIIVVDGHSEDGTVEAVRELGIPVYFEDQVLAEQLSSASGKGEALWKSLYLTEGDIIAWIDSDIENFSPSFVYGIIGPLLNYDSLDYVKAFYRRPLKVKGKLYPGGGGRVTELMARPLLNMFYPPLAKFIQPLSGEYAGRRELMESIPFYTGYGVEIGMLIDIYKRVGIDGMAQVDLGRKIHYNQSLESLSRMAFGILQTVIEKLDEEEKLEFESNIEPYYYKLVAEEKAADLAEKIYHLNVDKVKIHRRPPMEEIYYRLNSA